MNVDKVGEWVLRAIGVTCLIILICAIVVGVSESVCNNDCQEKIETHVDPYWNIVCKIHEGDMQCFAMEELNVDY